MPSCIAQDVAENKSYSEALVPAGGAAPSVRAAGGPPVHDCGWCRIADRDHGPRCEPGLCRHRGKPEPKPKCPHEKASGRGAAAETAAAAPKAATKPAKKSKARAKALDRAARPRPRAR